MEKVILVNNTMSDYRGVLDYRGVGLERFHCIPIIFKFFFILIYSPPRSKIKLFTIAHYRIRQSATLH